MTLPLPRPRRWLAGMLCLLAAAHARAEEPGVPVPLQAELLSKIASYDTNLPARAGNTVRVLIVVRPGNAENERAAAQLRAALASRDTIARLPHAEETVPFTTGAALAEACRARRAAILYLPPGFTDAEIESIRAALSGEDVLTVGALPRYVRDGVVVGFDLAGGKTVLLAHLGQAPRQHVALDAALLRLMTVYR